MPVNKWVTPVLLAGAIAAISMEHATAALVTNGGFESGNLTGWTTAGLGSPVVSVTASSPPYYGAYQGNFQVFLRTQARGANTAEIYQDVATTAGQAYTLTFAVRMDNSGSIGANINGTVVQGWGANDPFFNHFTVPPVKDYQALSTTFTATGALTHVGFTFFDDAFGLYLDNVALTANAPVSNSVPEPSTLWLGLAGLTLLWDSRRSKN